MIVLRGYQELLIDDVAQTMRLGHRRIVAVMPTGAGKGTTIGAMVERALAKGKRILILAHRAELIQDLSNRINALEIPHGVIAAHRSMDFSKLVQVGSVQTVVRRLHKIPAPDLIIQDEAHHLVVGNTWGKIIDYWPDAYLIGKTATPIRTDGRGLGKGQGGYFTAMVQGPSAQWLVDHGYLAPARVFRPPGFDVAGLKKKMGDYDMSQASEMLKAGQIMGDCLAHYRQYLDGKTAIAFCCSVAHAEAVAELFNRNGIPAASIDGSMRKIPGKCEQLLADLASGKIKVLANCELIGEGVDVPSVNGCIILRPTASTSLYLQMVGRCLRPQDGKTAIILDHVGNTLRLGHHLEEREWTLEGLKKRDREKAPSVKVCPKCFSAMPSGKAVCGECGHKFTKEKKEIEQVDGELVEVDSVPNTIYREQAKAKTLDQLIEVGKRRGMKYPHAWAKHVLAARQSKGQWESMAKQHLTKPPRTKMRMR
jgi:superfamily II DNA or RNA helicase